MRYLILIPLLIFASSSFATSEQYVVRTEATFCKYKPGKGYKDVIKHAKKYEKFFSQKMVYSTFVIFFYLSLMANADVPLGKTKIEL